MPRKEITNPELAVWSLLELAPAEPPPNNTTARVNGEYGGFALDPGSLVPPHPEWAAGKCRGYGSKNSPQDLATAFVAYSKDIARLRDELGGVGIRVRHGDYSSKTARALVQSAVGLT